MHYQKSDSALKPYVDLVRSKAETRDKVLSLARAHDHFLENFCVYVKDVLSDNGAYLDDESIERISCITLSTYGFYF